MIDIRPAFDPAFWFNLSPVALSPTFSTIFFLVFAGFIIGGALLRIKARHKKDDRYLVQIYRRIAAMLTTMGIVGLVLFFFTYEEIFLFGARFWYLLWAIGLGVWIWYIVKFIRKTVPELKADSAHKAEGNKYLPRKNRK